jgi:hypothetical protein
MVNCGVLFEVRTESINIMWTSFGFKGLKQSLHSSVFWWQIKIRWTPSGTSAHFGMHPTGKSGCININSENPPSYTVLLFYGCRWISAALETLLNLLSRDYLPVYMWVSCCIAVWIECGTFSVVSKITSVWRKLQNKILHNRARILVTIVKNLVAQ